MTSITAGQLTKLVNGKLFGDGDRELIGVAPLETADRSEVSFLANAKYARLLEETQAGVVLVAQGIRRSTGDCIETLDPYAAFVMALEFFNPAPVFGTGIHPTAIISEEAAIDEDVYVGPGCIIESSARIGKGSRLIAMNYIGQNARIGAGSILHPGVHVRHDCEVGERVTIHCGTIVGSDGFGFAMESGRFRKIPQVGIVVIESDVEIGANSTIDRATMGETRIGEGTKIDNLVQIAHNVRIGKHCVIAAQAGISGSTQIGDYCRIGGQAGFVGHIRIGDGSAFGAQSGVATDVAAGEILSGSPARPHNLWKRMEAALPRLPELLRRVRRIEERLGIEHRTNEEKSER
ncbi:UDP-3-O-(3-hydroxymyristoyl)glucosamine N-acyltransferase [bacterium]|nr:UDP-3-O-(3-hydroxymyristoyl)glucosamine N-acyltransferase [bacterium]